jgi:predicted dehydrogenase
MSEPSLLSRLWHWYHPTQIPIKQSNALRFGLIGATKSALHTVVHPTQSMPNAIVKAVACESPSAAKAFASANKIPKAHTSIDALLQDEGIDAVYISLPASEHYTWAAKALEAKKHVLLREPWVMNSMQAEALVALAKRNGVVVLQASHYLFHPAIRRARQLIQNGHAVQRIDIRNLYPEVLLKENDPRLDRHMGGGAFLHLGTSMVALARYLYSEEPVEVALAEPAGVKDGVDDGMQVDVLFSNNRIARLSCSFRGGRFKGRTPLVRITGPKGTIKIKNYRWPGLWHKVVVRADKDSREEQRYGQEGWSSYRYMMHEFVKACKGDEVDVWIPVESMVSNTLIMDQAYQVAKLPVRKLSVVLEAAEASVNYEQNSSVLTPLSGSGTFTSR